MARFKPVELIYSTRFLDHDTGDGHVDSPERLTRILETLYAGPLGDVLTCTEPDTVEQRLLFQVHSMEYVMRFEEACLSGAETFDHPDNRVCYDTFQTALLAAGACQKAVDRAQASPGHVVMSLVRPPGHHAESSRPLGFCFLNNVCIAARYWQQRYGVRRIFILDFDAHHGNGIQSAFETDDSVFYASIHEDPAFSFPGTGRKEETGKGAGKGCTLNLPLPQGTDDRQVTRALEDVIRPAMERFRPECIIAAAGFDGHEADDISGLSYSTELYGRIGTFVAVMAERFCSGRVVSILEGGYSLDFLGPSVERYLGGLALRI